MRSRSLAAAGAGLLALAVAATAGASPEGTAAQGCAPRDNIEAIIDDSQSMEFTDPRKLRLRAMELFIDHPGNERLTLGAIEFGTDASAIFPPRTIGTSPANMKAVLGAELAANDGATDYNDAFALAGTHNPNATARLFLTDGEHTDEVPYGNGHRGGPPVYVVGLNVLGVGGAVLQQIADETGGIYRAVDTAGELQSAVIDVTSAIGCLPTPVTRRSGFTRRGQTANRAVRIPAGIRSITATLSWDNEEDAFDMTSFRVVRRGRVVARKAAVRKLRVTKRRGATFVTAKIGRLVRGKLRFKVRATRISTPGVPVQVTTQIVRRRRR